MSRREFLTRGGQVAAGVVAGSAMITRAAPAVSNRIMGANDRINMAIVGIRSRGRNLISNFAGVQGVNVKTIVDVDANLFAERAKQVADEHGYSPGTETDMRKAFDDKEIDAIATATPNHWHALTTIWAVQAGKHVYVEKPSCHNIWEGRKMVEAAREHNRLVQVGFQTRSNSNIRRAIQFLHEGGIGEVYLARGLCFKPRNDIGRYPDGPLADSETYSLTIGSDREEPAYTAAYLEKVDYDQWLGPAPKRPFNRNRFHYNWHWHWDYGNGDTGNQGPHQFDIARWGLNKNEHPVKISSTGGMFAYDSSQETPNTQTSLFEYADGVVLEFGTRGLFTNSEDDITIGDLFLGSEGWMHVKGGAWRTYFGRNNEPGPSSESEEPVSDPMNLAGSGGEGHIDNFIHALRTGKREDLNCDIEEGNMSTALPHLANISYLVGHDLTFDGKKEKFVGDREADKLLTRKYRKPYVVPDKV
ncbi:MAG: Gfo/Idh/MocA family oxidoreductase [Fidelibacterota bacterium]|nr:MAG: Gfo/Idh/MocA family oxidoreductase [Candidatus Neomarinimicrobiota bacterium]